MWYCTTINELCCILVCVQYGKLIRQQQLTPSWSWLTKWICFDRKVKTNKTTTSIATARSILQVLASIYLGFTGHILQLCLLCGSRARETSIVTSLVCCGCTLAQPVALCGVLTSRMQARITDSSVNWPAIPWLTEGFHKFCFRPVKHEIIVFLKILKHNTVSRHLKPTHSYSAAHAVLLVSPVQK